jgi:hypothetical protein
MLEYTPNTTVGLGVIELLGWQDAPNREVVKDITQGTSGNLTLLVTAPADQSTGSVDVTVHIEGTTLITAQVVPNPVLITGATQQAVITFNVDPATPIAKYTFTFSGHKSGDEGIAYGVAGGGKGYINVVAPPIDPSITLNLTIPVEEGTNPTTFPGRTRPQFTIRFYNGLTKTYEKTNIAGSLVSGDNTKYTATVTAPRIALSNEPYSGLPNGAYSVFIRSDRHLWKKFVTVDTTDTDTITIDSSTNYEITFPILKIGDLQADNQINGIDMTWLLPDYLMRRVFPNLLGDLNNDGKVNGMDVSWMFGLNHFYFWGDKLSNGTNP